MVKFSKFCFESLHGDTDRCCCVEMSTRNRQNCALFTGPKTENKNKILTPSQTVATAQIGLKICQGQPQRLAHTISDLIQIGSLSAES